MTWVSGGYGSSGRHSPSASIDPNPISAARAHHLNESTGVNTRTMSPTATTPHAQSHALDQCSPHRFPAMFPPPLGGCRSRRSLARLAGAIHEPSRPALRTRRLVQVGEKIRLRVGVTEGCFDRGSRHLPKHVAVPPVGSRGLHVL